MDQSRSKCAAGCKVFTGGEIYHTKGCVHYPDSMSKLFDELKKQTTWISVKDIANPPKDYTWYIVTYDMGPILNEGIKVLQDRTLMYNKGEWFTVFTSIYDMRKVTLPITHFMSLPKAPEK
jgi:hypothetical protein